MSGQAHRVMTSGLKSNWRTGASAEAQGEGHCQQLQGDGPSPLPCPALGFTVQDRDGHTGENSQPSAPVGPLPLLGLECWSAGATRDSRLELCWHPAVLGGGRIWTSSTAPALSPAPASHPCCCQLCRVLAAWQGSSCSGQDMPGQLLLWLYVGSPRGLGTHRNGWAPQEQHFSCLPLSA